MMARTPSSMAARKGQQGVLDPAGGHHGHAVVGVHRGVAVAGEVLGAGGHAGDCMPADEGPGVAGDQVGVGAEGPQADDGVVGVGVHVGRGREVDGDAGGGQVARQVRGERLGQRHVVHHAERVAAGTGAAGADFEPGHLAGLLVGADQGGGVLRAQRRRQPGDLGRIGDVAGEQHHPGQALAEPSAHPVRRGVAGETRQEHGVGHGEEVTALGHDSKSNRKVSYLLEAFSNVSPCPPRTNSVPVLSAALKPIKRLAAAMSWAGQVNKRLPEGP